MDQDELIEKALSLLEKAREEIQNFYGKDTELTEEMSEWMESVKGLEEENREGYFY